MAVAVDIPIEVPPVAVRISLRPGGGALDLGRHVGSDVGDRRCKGGVGGDRSGPTGTGGGSECGAATGAVQDHAAEVCVGQRKHRSLFGHRPSADQVLTDLRCIGLWLAGMRDGRASVGYWVIAAPRGRGLAGHALTALSRWGLARPGIHRLELYVESWNVASWRAAERAGYEREGLLRSGQQVGDQRRDMFMYSLSPPGSR